MIKRGARRQQIVVWLGLAVALLILLLFAYLGHFSRLMSDDYCAIAVGKELGAWQGMSYWFTSWAGSYTNFFFKSAIAPLDTLAPAVTPATIIGLWWLALAWLVANRAQTTGVQILLPRSVHVGIGRCCYREHQRLLLSAITILVFR